MATLPGSLFFFRQLILRLDNKQGNQKGQKSHE
jgi:hypothetical protein